MSRAVLQKINSDALLKEIKKRDLTLKQIDEETGRANGYMSKAIKRGSIAPSEAHLLGALYNISTDAYFEAEEEPEEEPEQISMDPPLPQEIQDAIYNSVLTMCKALTESATQLAGPMARIAAALEAQEDRERILPWNVDITDEEAGGEF